MMDKYLIMTILVSHRRDHAIKLQETLTKSGCIIKTRLGIHQAGDVCSENGLIILELVGDELQATKLKNDLNHILGIKADLSILVSDW
jgi:hypothetical protein